MGRLGGRRVQDGGACDFFFKNKKKKKGRFGRHAKVEFTRLCKTLRVREKKESRMISVSCPVYLTPSAEFRVQSPRL